MKHRLITIFAISVSMTVVSCRNEADNQDCSRQGEMISNPITHMGSSPCLTYFEGKYYHCQSSYVNVSIRCSETISGLYTAKEHTIFYSGKDRMISAPRLYHFDDVWYIYYSTDDGDFSTRKIHVLCNDAHSPLEGKWEHKAIIPTGMAKSIHPSVFRHENQLYLFWSGTVQEDDILYKMGIYCCKLANPWKRASEPKLILTPEYEWECQWATGDKEHDRVPEQFEEAPIAIYSADSTKVLLYFAASSTSSQFYCEGMAFCDADDELTEKESWTKLPNPVFIQQNDSDIHGPGHVSFVSGIDRSERLYYVYHAYNGHPTIDRSNRTPRIQIATWDENGIPILGIPDTSAVPAPVIDNEL